MSGRSIPVKRYGQASRSSIPAKCSSQGFRSSIAVKLSGQGFQSSISAKCSSQGFRPSIAARHPSQAFRSSIPAKRSGQGFRRRISVKLSSRASQPSVSVKDSGQEEFRSPEPAPQGSLPVPVTAETFLTGKKFLSSLSGCCLPSGRKAWYPESERKGLQNGMEACGADPFIPAGKGDDAGKACRGGGGDGGSRFKVGVGSFP